MEKEYNLYFASGYGKSVGSYYLIRATSLSEARESCAKDLFLSLRNIIILSLNDWESLTEIGLHKIKKSMKNYCYRDCRGIWRRDVVSEDVFNIINGNIHGNIYVYDHEGDNTDFDVIRNQVINTLFLRNDSIKSVIATDMKYSNGLYDIDLYLDIMKDDEDIFFVFPSSTTMDALYRLEYSIHNIDSSKISHIHYFVRGMNLDKLYKIQILDDLHISVNLSSIG